MLQGASYLRSPSLGGTLAFPESAPIAAFDGDLSTAWVADRYIPPSNRYIEIGFSKPTNVPYVDVYPLSGPHGIVTEVDVDGVQRHVGLGWARIPVNLHGVSSIRVRIDHVEQPKTGPGPGGFREIRIPGFHVRQLLRTPVVVARALAGRNLTHSSLTYVFERTTGDNPFLRNRYRTSPVLETLQGRGDAEQYIERATFTPAARSYSLSAWINPAVSAPDLVLEHLSGGHVQGRQVRLLESIRRPAPVPRVERNSDGRTNTAWISDWVPGDAPDPVGSHGRHRRPLAFPGSTLSPPTLPVARPTEIQLSWPGGTTSALPVRPDDVVVFPHPVRARTFRLTVLAAQYPANATPRERLVNAVGIGPPLVPGLRPAAVPRSGPLRSVCGAVQIQMGPVVRLAAAGTIAELDAGQPLRASSCGAPTPMAAGIQVIRSLPGLFSVDLLRLYSAAPAPVALGAWWRDPRSRAHRQQLREWRARRAEGAVLVGAGREFRSRLAGHLQRTLARRHATDRRIRERLAGPADCRFAAFTFGPQRSARLGHLVSAVICLILVCFRVSGRYAGGSLKWHLCPPFDLRAAAAANAAMSAIGISCWSRFR